MEKTTQQTATDSGSSTENKETQPTDSSIKNDTEPNMKNGESQAQPTEAEEKATSDLWIEFEIHADKKDVDSRIDRHADEYARKARIPGFRTGMVPVDVVKSRYRKLLIDEALNDVIESFVSDKIRSEKLQVISRPEVKDVKYEEGGDLHATVVVEILPEVKLPDLGTVTVEVPVDQLPNEDFKEEDQIDQFLERNRRREKVEDRPVNAGDFVSVKHQARNLKTHKMSPRKPMYVHVSSEEAAEIPDIDKEIIGRNLNEEVVFTREFPADFARKSWAGNTMEHHVTIEEIFIMKKPELDSEMLKTMGFDDRKAFVEKLKSEYSAYIRKARQDRIIASIVEHLTESIEFPVPQSLVHQEMLQTAQRNPAMMQARDEAEKGQRIQELEQVATRNIRFSLILEAAKEEFKVKVDAEALETKFKEMAESNNVPLKEVRKYYAPAERRQQIMDSMERDRTLEILQEKITIKEV